MSNTPLVRLLILAVVLPLSTAAPPVRAIDTHPLFNNDILGNRAEIVTLYGIDDHTRMPLVDFDGTLTTTDSFDAPCLSIPSSLTDNLRVYWNFDTDFTATWGGSAYDGTETGATIDPGFGRFGGAAFFERANTDYITIDHPVVTQGRDHTYSAWYLEDTGNVNDGEYECVLETFGPGGPGTFGRALKFYEYDPSSAPGDRIGMQTQWSTGNLSRHYGPYEPDKWWNNVIVTYDASAATHSIYWNGLLMGTGASSDSLLDTGGLLIGRGWDGATQPWNGWIDEVAFWDRVLSPAEIAALQARPVLGTPPNLQQLDLACGDFDGDYRDDVVAAFTTVGLPDPHARGVSLVVGSVQGGALTWDVTTDSTAFYDTAYVATGDLPNLDPTKFPAPGNVRLVAGNVDPDDDREILLATRAHDAGGNPIVRVDLLELDGSRRPVPLTSVEVETSPDSLCQSARFDIAAGDLDGDAVDELIVAGNRYVGNNIETYVKVFRYDPVLAQFAEKCETSVAGSAFDPERTYSVRTPHHGKHRDRIAVTTGRFRAMTTRRQIVMTYRTFDWLVNWGDGRFTETGMAVLFTVSPDSTGWSIALDDQIQTQTKTLDFGYESGGVPVIYPLWFTGQSLGVETGDLDVDGRDDIALAAGDSILVFTVAETDTGAPLPTATVLAFQLNAGVGTQDGDRPLNDPSRRVLQIVDLDADVDSTDTDWQPEIVVLGWPGTGTSDHHQRIYVYRPEEDAGGTIIGLNEVYRLEDPSIVWPHGGESALLGADLDGDAFRIGEYTYHQDVASKIPTVILNAPPVLLDINPETASPDTIDLSGCYEPDAPPCDFRATYQSDTMGTISFTSDFKPGFGPSDGWAAKGWQDWPKKAWKKIKNKFLRDYGDDFSYTALASRTVQVGSVITASMDQDQIHSQETTWDVYEYLVYAQGDSAAQILVVVPQSATPGGWDTPVSWMNDHGCSQDDWYRLDHEAGNMLSYPESLRVDAIDELKSGYATISYGTGEPYHFWFDSTDFNSTTADTSRNSGFIVGHLVDAVGDAVGLHGQYTSDSLRTITNSMQSHLAVDVYFGSLNRTNWEYKVSPRMFWRDGILNVDYEIDFNGYKWDSLYAVQPDPGFVLPHRYDAVKDTTYDGANLYHSPDVTVRAPSMRLYKPYAEVGQTVTISADVRNFSLLACDSTVVEFYLWKEGWSSAVVLGTAVADTMSARGRAPTVSVDWVVPSWVDPQVRLYARIDPPSPGHPAGLIEEIHENNNIGYTILRTDGNGSGPPTGSPTVAWLPGSFALRQNMPNPFGPSTVIELALPVNARATLRVYDVTGRLVKTVVDQAFPAGIHPVRWDGRDSDGQRVASGVYFYRMESGDFRATRKMLVLR